MGLKQFVVTPAMGKRLIAKGLAEHPGIHRALSEATLVIVAGTTNGYVAEEILTATGQADGFTRKGFRRGVVVPPNADPQTVAAEFAGDVVLVNGQWQQGKTIFDVVDDLHAGDIVLKGGNALDMTAERAGVYIGHPEAGTIGRIQQVVAGRRVELIVPIGLEKRVSAPLDEIAAALNSPASEGPRMMPLIGQPFTEIDAIEALTGCVAELVAAGGVHGAEGAVWLAVQGDEDDLARAEKVLQDLASEPPCTA